MCPCEVRTGALYPTRRHSSQLPPCKPQILQRWECLVFHADHNFLC
jgi:hypothetical protein